MKRVYFFLFLFVILLLISCKQSSPSAPTTSTTTSTSTTTTSSSTSSVVEKPVVIRETGEGFDTIQEAIDAASEGQHIDVSVGTYQERITVDKQLYLVGEERNTTIIDGKKEGTVVTFTSDADGSDIRGFTIKNGIGSGASGIYSQASTLTIGRNVIKDNNYGIQTYSGGEISGVLIENNSSIGLYLRSGASPLVTEVTSQNNFAGIDCSGASPRIQGCIIRNNTDRGISCHGSANPDVGGGSQGSIGHNTIQGSNNNRDFYNGTANTIKAENNRWDHATASEIDSQDIYDDDEDPAHGAVDFQPFLTTTSFVSLRMKPRLLSISSLFGNFFRSLFRGDLPVSAIYLSRSFEPKIRHLQSELLLARYRPFTDERYYPPLRMRVK